MFCFVFKLKSSKFLFFFGVLVTLFVLGHVVFKDRGEGFGGALKETESLIFDHALRFIVTSFVLLVNLYYSAKLVEGVVHRQIYKILPWLVLNVVNIFQLTMFIFQVDSSMGYLALLVYIYTWMMVACLFFEIQKDLKNEIISMNQQSTGSVETIDVPYNNLSR